MHFKSWKFTGLLPWATLVFVSGYAMREVGAFHYGVVNIFIASQCLLYIAPPIYELANYVVLGRILYYVPYHSPLHPGRVITTFGGISAIIEALNANGASYSSNSTLSHSKRETGHALLKAALLLQLVILACFVSLAAYFHLRCRRNGILPTNLSSVLWTLYASSALVGTRTIYRTVEYFDFAAVNFSDPSFNPDSLSPVIRYEWFFWVFEGVLMLCNTYLLNVCHPGRFLPQNIKIYLATDGVTEIEGPGFQDRRNIILTILDPFDIQGLITRKDKSTRFWEAQDQGQTTVVGHRGAGETGGEKRMEGRNFLALFVDPFDLIGRATGERQRRKQRQIQGPSVPGQATAADVEAVQAKA